MITIPTLQELYTAILTDLETEFGVSINPFGKAFLRAQAAVQAGKLKLYYLAIGFLQKNIWVDTADPESVGGTLQRFGRVKLGRDPYPATQGQFDVTVTGTAGATIPAVTIFKSDDDSLTPGKLYILDNAFTLSGSSGSITLRALDAGTDALLAVTNTLTSTQPIPNVNSSAIVTAVAVSPVDAETNEQYRQKVIDSFRLSPQGGAVADYRLWGLEAAGTRQIYPYTASGAPTEINVFVEALPADSTDGKGTPTGTIITDVTNDIETDPVTGDGRRPMDAIVNVLPIVPLDVEITINSGDTITADQQTLIKQALNDGIYEIRPFIAGADIASEINDTVNVFGIGNLIIQAVGSVIISSISFTVDGSASTSYTFDNGEIPYIDDTLIHFV